MLKIIEESIVIIITMSAMSDFSFALILYHFIFVSVILKANSEDIIGNELLNLKGLDFITEFNPSKTYDGRKLVQGDIALPWSWNENSKQDMKGIINIATLWTNGRISYTFHNSVDDKLRAMIVEAMGEWEKHSCLKFTEKSLDFSYLRFRADKQGCWSMIGRVNGFFAGQDVSIGERCNRTYIIIHEIGHAIGFYHEQSRNDRDGYIHINWHNMPVPRYSQFDRGIESPRGVKYDYTSIMHYGPMAFTEKYFQKNTIASLNPHYQTLIGSGEAISFRDAKLINKLYSCSAGCPNKNQSMCMNDGFLSPYRGNGEPCICVCPPKSSGDFCENINESFEYYDLPPCGGNITEDTVIQTPGYPTRKPPADSCSWWMQAPQGKRIRVEFIDFSFHPRFVSNITVFNRKCFHERVEIRTRNRYDGDMFCGEDIPPGTMATSAGQEFIIIIDTNEKGQEGRGLKAKVSFLDEEEVQYSEQTLLSLLP